MFLASLSWLYFLQPSARFIGSPLILNLSPNNLHILAPAPGCCSTIFIYWCCYATCLLLLQFQVSRCCCLLNFLPYAGCILNNLRNLNMDTNDTIPALIVGTLATPPIAAPFAAPFPPSITDPATTTLVIVLPA